MASEQNQDPLATALEGRRSGWSVIDLPYKSKNPGREGWQNERLIEAAIRERFSKGPRNVGALLGEASSGLTDIDLDCPEARAVAPFILPPTQAIFGRPGSPRSHFLYYANPMGGDKEVPRSNRRRRGEGGST
jgi:hypothetical protein